MSEAALMQRRRNLKAIADKRRSATHCRRGHEYSEDNTLKNKNGTRACRECHNARHREYMAYYRGRKAVQEGRV